MAKPIIPWLGGKRRLAAKLLPLLPEHKCYVEPFAGAAALFFEKEPSKVEVLGDVNGELVNLYRVVQHHLEEFVRHLKWTLVSRETFEQERAKDPATLTDIQRAARFFYLQQTCFGARAHGQTFGTSAVQKPRFNLIRIEEELSAAHLRLHQVVIENLPWHVLVERYDRHGTCFFMDPPYYETAGYGVEWGLEDFERLAEALGAMKGKAVVTLGDHKKMRELFAAFEIRTLPITYTAGSGVKGKGARRRELVVRNWT